MGILAVYFFHHFEVEPLHLRASGIKFFPEHLKPVFLDDELLRVCLTYLFFFNPQSREGKPLQSDLMIVVA